MRCGVSDFVRAPGGGSQDNSRGPLLPQQSSPNPPWTGRKYSNYSLARLWLILAGPMALNNLSALAQKQTEAPRGWVASALTTGGSGGMPVAVG